MYRFKGESEKQYSCFNVGLRVQLRKMKKKRSCPRENAKTHFWNLGQKKRCLKSLKNREKVRFRVEGNSRQQNPANILTARHAHSLLKVHFSAVLFLPGLDVKSRHQSENRGCVGVNFTSTFYTSAGANLSNFLMFWGLKTGSIQGVRSDWAESRHFRIKSWKQKFTTTISKNFHSCVFNTFGVKQKPKTDLSI